MAGKLGKAFRILAVVAAGILPWMANAQSGGADSLEG